MIKPKDISVIIPTYKRDKYLAKCLDSILHQTVFPGEIVVVDNYPNPETRKITGRHSKTCHLLRYLAEKKKGATYARNLAIRSAKGKVLAFLDDDCVAAKNWIENITDFFRNNPKSQVVTGLNRNAISDSFVSEVEYFMSYNFFNSYRYFQRGKEYSWTIDTKNFAVKKDFVLKNNLFFDNVYADYPAYEDVDFGFRIAQIKVKINYSHRIKVFHHGKTNFFEFIKRWYNIGKRLYVFNTNWFESNQHIKQRRSFQMEFYFKQGYRVKRLRKLNFEKYLSEKTPIFKSAFIFLFFIRWLAERLGFFFMRLKHKVTSADYSK